jgi:XTP/dITP diphosphohydrolase
MMELLVVTKNKGKLQEIIEILGDSDISFRTLADYPDIDIEESGETFLENALIKAKTAATEFKITTLADDSGLVVDALGGRPGVYSRRFAGKNATDEDNNILLLDILKNTPFDRRAAHFVSEVVVCKPDGSYISGTGRVDGLICFEAKGDYGFGYDPIFFMPSMNKTFAELENSEKNEISHRKIALEKIRNQIYSFLYT